MQCQNLLTWTCFWCAVLDLAACSITVFPAIGRCRIWTIPGAMSGSVLTADTARTPGWPLCPLAIHSCTNDKGRHIWLRSCLSNKSRKINVVPQCKNLKHEVLNKCACFEGEGKLSVGKVTFKIYFKPCKILLLLVLKRHILEKLHLLQVSQVRGHNCWP